MAKAHTRLAIAHQVFAIFPNEPKEKKTYTKVSSAQVISVRRRQWQLEFNQSFLINKSLRVIRLARPRLSERSLPLCLEPDVGHLPTWVELVWGRALLRQRARLPLS